jgi:drug/metabolite transporter (DMT)-like permease
MAPFLIVQRHTLTLIPMSVWGLILATGVAQTVYFFGLAGAYKRGDISLAYPLARALPILFVVAVSLSLGHKDDIGGIGLVGMVLITAGCIILPLPHFQKVRWRDYWDMVYLMALIAAIGTTGYTLFDDQALRQLREISALQLSNGEITLLFISLQTISTAFMIGLGTIFYRPERRQLLAIFQNRSLIILGLVTGVFIMATYGLVLMSMAYVTNVSYVAAFRQLSIPIGAMLGLTLQHEPRYLPKLIGIGIITVGLILVGIG